ncbi:hypothetical protein GCM10022224_055160 [Nonomuraea antimicrobica]|uniref:CHAT domain-containing protein n=2 Tax=Nonomuraea antimicrobica TaxID=561173 RepID=A0ABP7C904_9ACTN
MLAEQWTSLLGRIRATAGFDQFLRPPGMDRLHEQAADGPIIMVYSSRWGSGASIVTGDPEQRVRVVPLPDLTPTAAAQQVNRLWDALRAVDGDFTGRARAQQEMHALLGWLWDAITGPVLRELGIAEPSGPRPRVWWGLVGVLAYLPIHAAGHHNQAGQRSVLDRTVSSYLTTIRALEHARARPAAPADSAAIIAMPTTPDAPDLPQVDKEIHALSGVLPDTRIITGPAATHHAVAEALARHPVAHFSCHGLANLIDPAASELLLYDYATAPFTVAALARLHLADASLAYLSACSTTHTSPDLADEAIHLTGAIHLAGYGHVVGTLWPVNDLAATAIATDFYAYLTNGGTELPDVAHSALALSEATLRLRDRYPALPTRWAAHHHQGS